MAVYPSFKQQLGRKETLSSTIITYLGNTISVLATW